MANKKEIRGLIRYLKALPPKRYHQDGYFCGTTACLAGHEALRRGWKRSRIPGMVKKNEVVERVFDVAQQSLGLTGSQALQLFAAYPGDWTYSDEFLCAETHTAKLAVAIKELETYL
jgi:hypothetical protein